MSSPTVKLHILPLVWIFTLGKGEYGGAGGSSWDLPCLLSGVRLLFGPAVVPPHRPHMYGQSRRVLAAFALDAPVTSLHSFAATEVHMLLSGLQAVVVVGGLAVCSMRGEVAGCVYVQPHVPVSLQYGTLPTLQLAQQSLSVSHATFTSLAQPAGVVAIATVRFWNGAAVESFVGSGCAGVMSGTGVAGAKKTFLYIMPLSLLLKDQPVAGHDKQFLDPA